MTIRKATIAFELACILLVPAVAQEPLTIDDAVKKSIARNLLVQAAHERIDQARARVGIVRSARLPSLELRGEYNRVAAGSLQLPSLGPGVPPQTISVSPSDNTVTTIEARQAVYAGGLFAFRISQASALHDVALGSLAATEAQIALQTRESYYSALLAQSLVASQELNLAAARQHLSVAQDKLDAGAAAKFDVLRAQATVSEAEQSLEEARSRARSAVFNLNRLIAEPISQDQQLVEPAMQTFPAEDVEALVKKALGQRGEVLAARAQFVANEAGIEAARAERRPQIAVTAGYQQVSKESPVLSSGLTFTATASLPIYEGGRISANISQAKSARDEARTNLEETLLEVEQDVRQQYLALQTARQTIVTAEARLAQALEAHDISIVRYDEKVGTAVEVADALATLSAARTNLDQSRSNYSIAYARLQRALGVIAPFAATPHPRSPE